MISRLPPPQKPGRGLVSRLLVAPWAETGREWLAAFESCLPHGGRAASALVVLLGSTLASWWVYVPAHELLHVLGCVGTGGSVEVLQIAPHYGGAILAGIFPFVRSEGDYAGRLSGFDTGGSDLTYLATDAAPYLLTLFCAFPLLRACARRRSALLFGPATVLLAAPLIGLVGDFYEMGSILVSRALAALQRSTVEGPLLALRHDDLFALLADLPSRFPPPAWPWALAVLASLLAGAALVSLSWAVGSRIGVPAAAAPGPRGGR